MDREIKIGYPNPVTLIFIRKSKTFDYIGLIKLLKDLDITFVESSTNYEPVLRINSRQITQEFTAKELNILFETIADYTHEIIFGLNTYPSDHYDEKGNVKIIFEALKRMTKNWFRKF